MKKIIAKKIGSLVLTLAVMLSVVLSGVQPVLAAEGTTVDLYKSNQEETAAATVEAKIPFQVQSSGKTSLSLVVDHVSNLTVALYNGKGELVSGLDNPHPVSADSFQEGEDHKFTYEDNWNLTEGTYTCGLTFAEDTVFSVRVYRKLPKASISKKKIGITAGFSQTLSVSGAEVKSWASRKKSTATVDKKGKVTGKKPGKTTITATLVDGRKLACAVTVYKNEYTDTKGTISMVHAGKVIPQPYRAYFDSKGNLKVKVNFLNATSKNMIALTDLKITVKDKNKKTMGIYSVAYQSVKVPSNTSRAVTFTIPKSEVTKKGDLRKGIIYINGHYQAKRAR